MANSITIEKPVNSNVVQRRRVTIDEAIKLTDTVTGTIYKITVENGVLTPVEVSA